MIDRLLIDTRRDIDWVMLLPFTAGGFLYIALVSLLPTFLQEKTPRESLVQLGLIAMGVACVHGLTCTHL
uniref:MFS transporter n=1 Tax=Mesocestoides corti TaxID=53468 RepID=A0A5K3FIB6_MESCO